MVRTRLDQEMHRLILSEEGRKEIHEELLELLYSEDALMYYKALHYINILCKGLDHVIHLDLPESRLIQNSQEEIKAFGLSLLRKYVQHIAYKYRHVTDNGTKRLTLILMGRYNLAIQRAFDIVYPIIVIYETFQQLRPDCFKNKNLFKLASKLSYRYAIDEFILSTTNLIIRESCENLFELQQVSPYETVIQAIYKSKDDKDKAVICLFDRLIRISAFKVFKSLHVDLTVIRQEVQLPSDLELEWQYRLETECKR